MAKKQTAKTKEDSEAAPTAAAPAEQAPAKKERKPREPKAKTAPAGPVAEVPSAASAPTADSRPVAPAAAAGAGEPKKRRKQPGNPPPLGKKLKNHLKNVQQRLSKEGPLPLKRAIALLKQIKRVKFDETVEIHMALGIDTSQNDQMVRGSVPLPHGIGKSVRVLVFCQGDNIAKAKEAGADHAGSDDIIEKIQKEGWVDFD